MARKRRTKSASPRRRRATTKTRRRSRRRSGMGAGVFSNPFVGVAVGAVAVGLAGGFLAKPGKDGKPMIESPMLRAAAAVGAGMLAARFLKAPAVGLGGLAAGVYVLAGTQLFKTSPYGLAEDAQVSWVDQALLSENATTLADGDGNVWMKQDDGSWSGPYASTGY